MSAAPDGPTDAVTVLLSGPHRQERVRHVESIPARTASEVPWPDWADPEVVTGWARVGVHHPWRHQVEAAELAWAGRDVVVSTGTASGKSLAYLLPALSAVRAGAVGGGAVRAGQGAPRAFAGRGATALYLAPTKALAADQLAAVTALQIPDVRAGTFDGDTPVEERRWVRDHAGLVLTNPDMLHHSLLPGHERWAPFLRRLRFVVVDECHHYRGVFGSHVAAVLRRLRRIAEHYGADPVFVLASATTAEPAASAQRLTGSPLVVAVTGDASPRGRMSLVLWEPPLLPGGGERGAPTRRSAVGETADLMTDLVSAGIRTLAFVPSRRGAESVAASARRSLAEVDPALAERVSAYRGGYLPEERRALEAALRSGSILGLASTNALELGVDVAGLDAVLICGWPGRRSSLWQQAGRAGRRGGDALAVLIARDDPLDTYLVHHPESIVGASVEATVLDPDNPYVLSPQLCAAAAELPLRPDDVERFGPSAAGVLDALVDQGLLRRRPAGWFWTQRSRAGDLADLRGTGGEPVRIVEEETGRVLGTVDAAASHHTVHEGAVYVHQGRAHLVRHLDLVAHVALVSTTGEDVATQARSVSDIRILHVRDEFSWGPVGFGVGSVEVTQQVTGFLTRDAGTGRVLGESPLDLPVRTLTTSAVWWSVAPELLAAAGVDAERIPGAAHAAEHAAIGMLPLVATCDRWDVGGVSTALHPDTGLPTIFVHDGHPGGAGFAERGYAAAADWLRATREAIGDCECELGCPSCVQSPKCGNGNEPLDKDGAAILLDVVLAQGPASDREISRRRTGR